MLFSAILNIVRNMQLHAVILFAITKFCILLKTAFFCEDFFPK